MAARKKGLARDLQQLTWAELRFEYEALRAKEKEDLKLVTEVVKAGTTILRDVLVSVLGLNLFVTPEMKKAAAEGGDMPAFVPGSLVFANHHLLRSLVEEAEKAEVAEVPTDEAFEAFSAKLAKGDFADMDPVLLGNFEGMDKNTYWRSTATQAALRSMGVSVRPADAPQVPHIGRKKPARVVFDDADDGETALPEPPAEHG